METHLRLILFLVGVIILTLVILDMRRQRNLKKQKKDELWDQEQLEPMLDYEHRQQSLDFGTEFNHDNCNSTSKIVVQEEITQLSQDVFALFVMARDSRGFQGSKLQHAFNSANLIYGKFNIFHKFDDNKQDKILFSVASAVEPGAFDLQKLDLQFIPGITIFMLPTMVSEPKKAFDALVRTAKQLAFSLNGELRDQERNPLTLQMIDKYKYNIEAYGSPLSLEVISTG